MNLIFFVQIMAVVQHSECAVPGAFFWKPRMELDLTAAEKPDESFKVFYPSAHNVQIGRVVLINGYKMGTTMLTLATSGRMGKPQYPQLDVTHGDFYTNAYRWTLRAISLLPEWLAGSGNYPVTHKVWKKRFYYMDEQLPTWMKSLLFYVDGWEDEADNWKRFKIYAKPSFDRHLRFPSRKVVEPYDFQSFKQSQETVENMDDSQP